MSEPVQAGTDPAAGRARAWLLAPVPLAIGLWFGYRSAYAYSLPGGLPAVEGVLLLFVIGVVAIVLGLVGAAQSGKATVAGKRAGRRAFATAGLLVLGTAAGFALTPGLGLGYHQPVVGQTAASDVSVDLPGVAGFVPVAGGRADCDTAPDSSDIAILTALNLGELGAGTLRAQLFIDRATHTAAIELFIDGGDLPEGSPMVTWDGEATLTSTSDGDRSGSAAFDGLALQGGTARDWPASLSGTLHWKCGS